MSPLGEAIYHVLAQRVGLENPLISYYELHKKLPPLDPPYDNITWNDERLFQALGEVGRACRDHGLPTLTGLVIRSMEQSPGSGYYRMFHPETGDDTVKQREAWESELERAKSTRYPQSLVHGSTERSDTHSDERQRSRPLGHIRVADNASRATIVFTGQIMCPRCAASLDGDREECERRVGEAARIRGGRGRGIPWRRANRPSFHRHDPEFPGPLLWLAESLRYRTTDRRLLQQGTSRSFGPPPDRHAIDLCPAKHAAWRRRGFQALVTSKPTVHEARRMSSERVVELIGQG